MIHSIVGGVGIGIADFLQAAAFNFSCYRAGIKIEKREFDPDKDSNIMQAVPTKVTEYILRAYFGARSFIKKDLDAQSLDVMVAMEVSGTAAEELTYRATLQPLVAKVLSTGLPLLRQRFCIGIPFPNLISAIAVACIFGAGHFQDYKQGGLIAATNIAIGGFLYGIAKERFGILSAIIAHSSCNLLGQYVWSRLAEETELTNKQTFEWNKAFIECLKKKEVSFDLPIWEGQDITSDITADFYFIAKSIDTFSAETKQKISRGEFNFQEIRDLVMQNGYSTNEEISEKLIELYAQENEEL